MTEELKRSQESYIQKVLEIAKEMPKAWSPDVRRQYYALSDIRYGLRAATKGLQALRELYSNTELNSQLLDLAEALEDYYSIARTVSIEALEEMGKIISGEIASLEEQDGNRASK